VKRKVRRLEEKEKAMKRAIPFLFREEGKKSCSIKKGREKKEDHEVVPRIRRREKMGKGTRGTLVLIPTLGRG